VSQNFVLMLSRFASLPSLYRYWIPGFSLAASTLFLLRWAFQWFVRVSKQRSVVKFGEKLVDYLAEVEDVENWVNDQINKASEKTGC
jgi:hypothetical protein